MLRTIDKNLGDYTKATYRRSIFPKGTLVELVCTKDSYTTLKPGDQGTVSFVDNTGTVFVDWDNGSTLGVVY